MALTGKQAEEKAMKQLSEIVERAPGSVVSVSHDEEGWHVKLGMVDRNGFLGAYDVLLDEQGDMIKFRRVPPPG